MNPLETALRQKSATLPRRLGRTGPFYVEVGDVPRKVHRTSVQFFIKWLAQRRSQVELAVGDPIRRQEIAAEFDLAEKFWNDLLERATAR